ncbi:MAG: radical SAM protein [Tannerellaceae bacterium]|jgi:MoaA/NifB/PqqE/SkfB family radical SAM enzyme|nr:radical SAM protein [Tannerellaceae bacterium]
MIRKLAYLGLWFVRARFMGRQAPLQTVLFISDQCNLSCKHCSVYRHEHPHVKSYEQVREELEYSYRIGSRFVDFEGGEPTLWRDGDHDLNSLIRLAKQIGFFSTTITTNAQQPFAGSEADSIWVSLDGLGAYHDDIRGAGSFERLCRNIATAAHPHLSANMVINARNYTSVEETIQFARDSPYIRSISLNFHTPYAGTEDLFLDQERRSEVIELIIRLKRQGYPIMNSVSGLSLMRFPQENGKRQCWVTNFIMPEGEKLAECQGRKAGVCGYCGFAMAGEMQAVFSFKLDTLLAGMNLRL